MRKLRPGLALTTALLITATGCTPAGTTGTAKNGSTAITINSCGRDVTFDTPPKRILAIGSEAPSLLVAAGAGDKITHYAGSLKVPFEQDTKALVERAERVSEDSHNVSYEMILNSKADVVIGTDITKGVDINALAKRLEQAGTKLLTVSGYCGGIPGRSTNGANGFDLIYQDVNNYGRLFGTSQKATESVKRMQDRVTAAKERLTTHTGKTAAPLYVPAKGGIGSYGGQSLVSEQMTALGLKNVFADVPKRYFEPSTEELIGKEPDLVFGMYLPTGSSNTETDEDVVKQLRTRPELKGLATVHKDGAVLPLNYFYTSPGPLAVDGIELIASRLSAS
ncbi:iron complex transport system substrate-binding protein [Austwickia chelonae]|uniref:Putative ABC transporter substrate-binding protein n=2 Tax=Austwickia TaxID=1184606 RepID=K6WBT3_9MICO|nr:putative ABC transporter substrate-binding protein [Austwickia chelonae NBRC 105200]SEW37981.1 iron complex transport system substrate-binding protein [Austwickia chelonae]